MLSVLSARSLNFLFCGPQNFMTLGVLIVCKTKKDPPLSGRVFLMVSESVA